MLRWTRNLSRRAILASALSIVTITAAGAATYHRLAVTQTAGGGSEGATEFLQTGASSSAVQGEVATSAYTALPNPFGLFGFYHGSETGIGTIGISSTGYGVAGAGQGSAPSILAYGEGSGAALQATTTSASNTTPAIFAEPAQGAQADAIDAIIFPLNGSTSNIHDAVSGVDGGNTGNANGGVLGITKGDFAGVQGYTSPGTSGGAISQVAVYGESTGNASGYGVIGSSDVGTGITANNSYGVALEATSVSNSAFTSEATMKASPGPDISDYPGVYASAENGSGVFAYSAQDPAVAAEMGCNIYTRNATEEGQNCSGLFIQMDGTNGYPLIVYEPKSTQTCPLPTYPFLVDNNGNILQCGSTSTAQVYQRNSNPDSDTATYTAKQTEATVEDYGTAQLVNGSASVALAADFKATMDARSPYSVSMMPHGDSNELYLASQNANGFVIRESEGGHSTISFDYRIVARPYGARLARLPHESQIIAHRPMDRPSERTTYAERIAAVDARNRALFPDTHPLKMSKLLASRLHRAVVPTIPAVFANSLQRLKSTTTR